MKHDSHSLQSTPTLLDEVLVSRELVVVLQTFFVEQRVGRLDGL